MNNLPTRRWQGALTKALIIENPDPLLDVALEKLGIQCDRLAEPPEEDELVRILQEGQHNFIYKRSRVEINERVLDASSNLAGVMLCCIGDDSVDKVASAKRGIMVTHDPVSNGRSVAELVIGEIISLSRRLYTSTAEMDASVWRKNNTMRFEIRGKRLGILGLGRIGRQTAQLAERMGMEIFFFDNSTISQEIGATLGWTLCDSIESLFRASDVVSTHVSSEDIHGNLNQNLLTYEHFKAISSKVYEGPRIFLNLARGFLFNPEDLKRAVNEGHITSAMTDVFPEEPSRSNPGVWVNPYADIPNIFATPHIGAATKEAQPRIAHYVARTTELFNRYGALRSCVYRPGTEISIDPALSDHLLVVVHRDTRGTRRAVEEAIHQAGASNLQSVHRDFPRFGIAYEVAALDRQLTREHKDFIIKRAAELTGDPSTIRWIRTIEGSQFSNA